MQESVAQPSLFFRKSHFTPAVSLLVAARKTQAKLNFGFCLVVQGRRRIRFPGYKSRAGTLNTIALLALIGAPLRTIPNRHADRQTGTEPETKPLAHIPVKGKTHVKTFIYVSQIANVG